MTNSPDSVKRFFQMLTLTPQLTEHGVFTNPADRTGRGRFTDC